PYGNSERRDRANDFTKYTENLDFELLTTVMKGIGLRDLSFNITDKGNGSCRRRIVCEADRLASTNPVVGYAIDLLRYIHPCAYYVLYLFLYGLFNNICSSKSIYTIKWSGYDLI
ncbi:hypothetical protein B7P43_G10787, partial [Cryptotermes secundus]